MSTPEPQLLPEVIYLDEKPRLLKRITIDGIEYACKGYEIARVAGRGAHDMKKCRALGMPFVPTQFKSVILYPIDACVEWIKTHTGDPRRILEIEIDGELCYNAVKAAEYFDRPNGTIRGWRDRGMPTKTFRDATFYPVERCKEWVREHGTLRHKTHGVRMTNRASLCNFCDNARAGRCSWFTDYTPVPGWTAVEKSEGYISGPSYFVKKCPNYKPDKPRKG